MTERDKAKREIAIRLKEAREKAGYNQEKFAEMIGISTTALSTYETGRRSPDVTVLKKICQLSGYSAEYILGLIDDPGKGGKYERWARTFIEMYCDGYTLHDDCMQACTTEIEKVKQSLFELPEEYYFCIEKIFVEKLTHILESHT